MRQVLADIGPLIATEVAALLSQYQELQFYTAAREPSHPSALLDSPIDCVDRWLWEEPPLRGARSLVLNGVLAISRHLAHRGWEEGS